MLLGNSAAGGAFAGKACSAPDSRLSTFFDVAYKLTLAPETVTAGDFSRLKFHAFDESAVIMGILIVVGFNIINFDYDVLTHYTPLDLHQVPTLDLMRDLEAKLGHRLSLESLAVPTLGAPKVADGMAALRWWKEGRVMDIAEYCCFDVKITKELHEYGRDRGEVFYVDRLGQKRSVKVKW